MGRLQVSGPLGTVSVAQRQLFSTHFEKGAGFISSPSHLHLCASFSLLLEERGCQGQDDPNCFLFVAGLPTN